MEIVNLVVRRWQRDARERPDEFRAEAARQAWAELRARAWSSA